jgi:hypothetical protein
MISAATFISGATALWKIATDFLTRANEAKKANVLTLIDYIDAARLSVAALEGQEIVAQALSITPTSDDATIQALRVSTISYLRTEDNRPKL